MSNMKPKLITCSIIFISYIYITSITVGFCKKTNNKLLQNIRKRIEEIPDNNFKEIENNSFVSFLVNNVKDIFNEDKETTTAILASLENTTDYHKPIINKSVAIKLFDLNSHNIENHSIVLEKEKRASVNEIDHIYNKFINKNIKANECSTTFQETPNINNLIESYNLSKNLRMFQMKIERENQVKLGELPLFKMRQNVNGSRRTCILCNNVDSMECNDPKNKMMSSITCDGEGDQCYSLHTPFRIVERGCINVNSNLTTYVCSCNLCNYISISEMPHVFSTKKDWIKNIIELSRFKHLKKSVLRDMSCLSCGVNIRPTKTEDALDIANCLEGNGVALPIQECAENEICRVKAIRSEGYVWRGCLTSPLYNYWWNICNTDLCNYDTIGSVYDEIH